MLEDKRSKCECAHCKTDTFPYVGASRRTDLKFSKGSPMSQSLLVYKNGKFSTADPVPDWYANMEQDYVNTPEADWDAVLTRAGFRELAPSEVSGHEEGTFVYFNDETNIFYAECYLCGAEIWVTTF